MKKGGKHMGLFDMFKKNDEHQSVRYKPGEKLCFDCKHCDGEHTKGDGQIYCKWDSEYYYPGAAGSCEDYVKFY